MKEFRYGAAVGWFLVLALFIALLPGFRTDSAVGEQVIVTGLGLDERDGQCTLSVQAVEALRTSASLSEQSESATKVYTAAGASVYGALQSFLNETGKSTYILQNQLIAVSEELCRGRSLFAVLDYLVRNQEGRALTDLVVCRGDPAELLALDSGNDAIPAEYVAGLLKEGKRWGLCVTARLLDAERAMSGMYDLAVPLVEMQNGTPKLAGTALFHNGEWAGELTVEQTTGLLLAGGEAVNGRYTVAETSFSVSDLHCTLNIQPAENGFAYTFAVRGIARVVEEGQPDVLSRAEQQALLVALQEHMAAITEAAVTWAVHVFGCDPLGLSRRTAARFCGTGVSQAQASSLLPYSRVRVSVTLSLTDTGLLS